MVVLVLIGKKKNIGFPIDEYTEEENTKEINKNPKSVNFHLIRFVFVGEVNILSKDNHNDNGKSR